MQDLGSCAKACGFESHGVHRKVNMIKLSIIIPYYDTYRYTLPLLKELQIQKTDEVEVIVVDDGCYESRLDEFSSDFMIIHDQHKGASAAWNTGIRNASGEFVGFIDSDDMIMMNYVEELLSAIDQNLADEIIFGYMYYPSGKVMLQSSKQSIWKAVYRRSIVPLFDEHCFRLTAIPFQVQLSRISHTHAYLDRVLYVYRADREGSITWNYEHGVTDSSGKLI